MHEVLRRLLLSDQTAIERLCGKSGNSAPSDNLGRLQRDIRSRPESDVVRISSAMCQAIVSDFDGGLAWQGEGVAKRGGMSNWQTW